MNRVLFLLAFFLAFESHAYTTKEIFECQNGDLVTVKSSLMPNGERAYSAVSKEYEKLAKQECEELNEKWQSYGSENCYANDKALFTHFGALGMLKFQVEGVIRFTLCESVEKIQ